VGLDPDKMPRSCEGDLVRLQARSGEHVDVVVAPEDVQIHGRVIYSLHSRLYSRLPDASRQSAFWELVEAQEKRGQTGPLKDPL
jgi:hypothetical protein